MELKKLLIIKSKILKNKLNINKSNEKKNLLIIKSKNLKTKLNQLEENITILNMKKILYNKDIVIDTTEIEGDSYNAGYNLGDLLNIPFLENLWKQNPHASDSELIRMNLTADHYPNSILSNYCKNRENDELIPNIKLIIESTVKFTNDNSKSYEEILNIVRETSIICVHVRVGDINVEETYINCIQNISYKFKKVILLCGIHKDERYKNNEYKINNFVTTINRILEKNNNIYVYLNTPDVHLSLMMYASNLLLHKGQYSCLGSIVATGNLFLTKLFNHANAPNWKDQVNKKYTLL